MSELINNAKYKKERLKELILKLHEGDSPELVKQQLKESLGSIPYGDVVEVEQELLNEGLPQEEVLKLCDIHGSVLHGNVDLSNIKIVEEGHPVDVFRQENKEVSKVGEQARNMLNSLNRIEDEEFKAFLMGLQALFNQLMDIDKHYQRKEYLVFPYLEKNEITGVPKVMWGKQDEIREHLKACIHILNMDNLQKKDLAESLELIFLPTLQEVLDMVQKENEILFPMCLDVITTEEWYAIHKQTMEFGFCPYDPQTDWKPEGLEEFEDKDSSSLNADGNIQLPSGSFTAQEIMAILNTVPVDMTFVDKNDKVKYFTQGKERVFMRNRSIINRDVRLCHPPGSTHIVDKILDDFKTGKATHAPFWIQMKGQFIKIEYFALHDENGEYLGTLEVSQDLSENRALEGERRILSYTDEK